MQAILLKRHSMRALLTAHLIGMAVFFGGRFADFVVERKTEGSDLQMLAFGRDLSGAIGRGLMLPGFLTMLVTGIAMTIIRYGKRPPAWVWIKVALNATAFFVVSPFVAPALTAARNWAHWSAEHGQLAPQFLQSAAQASFYGAIVFGLFLLNVPVAVWKPMFSLRKPATSRGEIKPPLRPRWLPPGAMLPRSASAPEPTAVIESTSSGKEAQ
jgi:hypothetical protein